MPLSVSILDSLRTETRADHEALEARLPLTTPALTLDVYVGILRAFRSVVGPLETRLAHLGLPARLDFGWRAPLLDADLAALGDPAGGPHTAGEWADLTHAAALGACYVLEGSTLGGQVIARHLAPLKVTAERGGAYFAGHGAQTGPRWKAFRAALDASVLPGEEAAVVAGARRTFHAFHRALT